MRKRNCNCTTAVYRRFVVLIVDVCALALCVCGCLILKIETDCARIEWRPVTIKLVWYLLLNKWLVPGEWTHDHKTVSYWLWLDRAYLIWIENLLGPISCTVYVGTGHWPRIAFEFVFQCVHIGDPRIKSSEKACLYVHTALHNESKLIAWDNFGS